MTDDEIAVQLGRLLGRAGSPVGAAEAIARADRGSGPRRSDRIGPVRRGPGILTSSAGLIAIVVILVAVGLFTTGHLQNGRTPTTALPVVGEAWALDWSTLNLGGGFVPTSVSCPEPGWCVAVIDGMIATTPPGGELLSGGATLCAADRSCWPQPAPLAPPSSTFTAVPAPPGSAAHCVVTGRDLICATPQPGGKPESMTVTAANPPLATLESVRAVSCASVRLCVAVGGVGLISVDGAATWERFPLPVGAGARAVSCTPGTAVCTVALSGPQGSSPALLRTTDGGAHWTASAPWVLTPRSQCPRRGVCRPWGFVPTALACPSVERCVATGSSTNGSTAFQVTTDGGARWRTTSFGPALSRSFGALLACPAVAWCAVTSGPNDFTSAIAVAVSRDGGPQWIPRPALRRSTPHIMASAGSLSCPTASDCAVIVQQKHVLNWACDTKGCGYTASQNGPPDSSEILTTTDGGGHWSVTLPATNLDPTVLDCPTPTFCLALGSAGALEVGAPGEPGPA